MSSSSKKIRSIQSFFQHASSSSSTSPPVSTGKETKPSVSKATTDDGSKKKRSVEGEVGMGTCRVSGKRPSETKDASEEVATTPTKKKSTRKTNKGNEEAEAETERKATTEAGEEPPAKKKWYPGQTMEHPPRKGEKARPLGASNCLENLSFVFTGVQDSLEREEAEHYVRIHGGNARKAISGKTSYLVVGIDPGQSKVDKAIKFGTSQISEDELFDMIVKKSKNLGGNVLWLQPDGRKTESQTDTAPQVERTTSTTTSNDFSLSRKPDLYEIKKESIRIPNAAREEMSAPITAKHTPLESSSVADKRPVLRIGNAEKRTDKPRSSRIPLTPAPALWVDLLAPKRVADMAGQGSNAEILFTYLRRFHSLDSLPAMARSSHHGGGSDRSQKLSAEALSKNAVLLSGPPGIGKTTLARLSCEEMGFDVVEFNASDTRNQSSLRDIVSSTVTNTSLSSGVDHASTKKLALLMDEIDGMSGNGDRGGVSELIQMIKMAKIPIICMCNDRYHPKLKSLVNHCVDLRLNRPAKNVIAHWLHQRISQPPFSLSLTTESLELMAESLNNDLRSIINNLQMFSRSKSSFTYSEIYEKMQKESYKNIDASGFSLAEKFVDFPSGSLRDRMDRYFVDAQLLPLYIQENYPDYDASHGILPPSKTPAEFALRRLRSMARASECISLGDVASSLSGRTMNFTLAPFVALEGCIHPGAIVRGRLEKIRSAYSFGMAFPSWLGKNSSSNKNRRLIMQASRSVQSSGFHVGSDIDFAIDVIPVLRLGLTKPLILASQSPEDSLELIDESISGFRSLGLVREDFDTIHDLSLLQDSRKEIDSKTKSAFTRKFNREGGREKIARSSLRSSATDFSAVSEGFDEDENGDNNRTADNNQSDSDDNTADLASIRSVGKKGKNGKRGKSSTRGVGKRGKSSK